MFIFLGIQLLLGFVTMMAVLPTYGDRAFGPEPAGALVAATTHQAVGAALLAVSTMLALWVFRLTTPGAAHARAHGAARAPATA